MRKVVEGLPGCVKGIAGPCKGLFVLACQGNKLRIVFLNRKLEVVRTLSQGVGVTFRGMNIIADGSKVEVYIQNKGMDDEEFLTTYSIHTLTLHT